MELWIRNQDRDTLVPIKDAITEFSEALIYRDGILGKYKTKERALEVLDEIQSILKPEMIMESNGGAFVSGDNNLHIINPTYQKIEQLNTYVYEMPKE